MKFFMHHQGELEFEDMGDIAGAEFTLHGKEEDAVLLCKAEVEAEVLVEVEAEEENEAATCSRTDAGGGGVGTCGAGTGQKMSWMTEQKGAGEPPGFQPNAPPSLCLPENFQPACEADFFKLFSTAAVATALAIFTNTYAHLHSKIGPHFLLIVLIWFLWHVFLERNFQKK